MFVTERAPTPSAPQRSHNLQHTAISLWNGDPARYSRFNPEVVFFTDRGPSASARTRSTRVGRSARSPGFGRL